jgi:CelD/BcsL family acetyltransferase involved in cellulose biosynthesis
MRPHWKLTAQRAANLTHTADDVREAMAHALKKSILEAPIAAVREIMNRDILFPELRIDQLEALRKRSPHSAATNTLIDCAVEAAGIAGEAGTTAAVAAALEEIARPAMRGIDEHYQRETDARASRIVRARLDEAYGKLNCGAIARELLASGRPPSPRSVEIPRHTGLDEGPPL